MRSNPPLPAATRILDDLRRIVRVLRESARASQGELGVSGAQLFALKVLSATPRLSLNQLAERTRTHQSSVSVVVKRLVDAQLVSRVTSPSDARRVELALTPKGRALLAKAPLAAQERLLDGIDRLSSRERESLARGLHRLTETMQLKGEPATMFFEEDAAQRDRPLNSRARKAGETTARPSAARAGAGAGARSDRAKNGRRR